MDNIHEMMEELLNTMEVLKQIERDIREIPPKKMNREQAIMLNALLNIISDVTIPDIHFLPTSQIIGEA
tara:strand:+ start:157 stop:363 length:207 start_codon:yes stop_codon:yes gene_type:complete